MKSFVVDASLAFAWQLPNRFSNEARRIRAAKFDLHAPDLIFCEYGNAIWKETRFGSLALPDGLEAVGVIQSLPLRITPVSEFVAEILPIAFETGRSFYDSTYLALAVRTSSPLATCDQKLFNALQGTRYSVNIVWVEDLPRS